MTAFARLLLRACRELLRASARLLARAEGIRGPLSVEVEITVWSNDPRYWPTTVPPTTKEERQWLN
jgi:hypothetical protein